MKRLTDIIIALLLVLLLSPFLLIITIVVALKMGTPIYFLQERPGKDGHVFRMFKFRSMAEKRDLAGNLLPDNERLTAFGKFLRKSSLDELPELWNILKGDMSLVGPRPLLVEYLPLYSKEQNRRHEVRPGITGWAQVNGRNLLSWDEKFALDVWYVENHSLALDARILWMTIKKVFQQEGISSKDSATMSRFEGQ